LSAQCPLGRGGKLYRYYLSPRDAKERHDVSGVRILPAGEMEEAVVAQLRGILRAPDMVAQVWREIVKRNNTVTNGMSEMQVRMHPNGTLNLALEVGMVRTASRPTADNAEETLA
jgi:hypothetical protein